MDVETWLNQLLARLEETGPVGQSAWEYLRKRKINVSLRTQPTGARWTARGHIELHPSCADTGDDAYALSLIVHEVRHIQQGWLSALSVQGELEGWQVQFSFLKSLTGQYHSDSKVEHILAELMSLPLSDRAALKRARQLMQDFAGRKYRIDLLPLYPLGREIWYWLSLGRASHHS
jgi:predicted SprT family Zn-dependent metalloprotease